MSESLETLLMRIKPEIGMVRITIASSVCFVETMEPGRQATKIIADADCLEACKRHLAQKTWRGANSPEGDPRVARRKVRQDAALLRDLGAA